MYNYLFDKCGLVHITIGDGGNNEGLSNLGNDPNGHCARYLIPILRSVHASHLLPCDLEVKAVYGYFLQTLQLKGLLRALTRV